MGWYRLPVDRSDVSCRHPAPALRPGHAPGCRDLLLLDASGRALAARQEILIERPHGGSVVIDPLLPAIDEAQLEVVLSQAASAAAALWIARRQPGSGDAPGLAVTRQLHDMPLAIEALPGELAALLATATPRGADPLDLAHIPSSGNAAALIADWFASAANLQTASAALAPQGVAIEAAVIGWLADFLGYGQPCAGLLTSGSSLANLIALVAARDAALPRAGREGLAGGVAGRLYASRAVHACIARAARILGLGERALVDTSGTDPDRIDPEQLSAQLRADRENGLRPIVLIATLGTTGSGACDPLAELAGIARDEDLWLHVDGAYGAPAAAVEPALAQDLALADSVALDLHKWLFLPYETGCLLVRDPQRLTASFSFDADYLELVQGGQPTLDPMQIGPELSRGLRALRIWATFRCVGPRRLREALRHCMRLARQMHDALEASSLLEAAAPVGLSIVCLRLRGSLELEIARADTLHVECLRRLEALAPPMRLSTVRRDGRLTLRACFTNPRTQPGQVEALLARLESVARHVTGVTDGASAAGAKARGPSQFG